MKVVGVACYGLLLVCLHSSNGEIDKRIPIKRVVRSSLLDISRGFTNNIQFTMIRCCVENGFTEIEDELQESFDKIKTCVEEKRLIIEPRDSYLKHIEDCSQDAIKKVKGCLKKEQRYFPDFLLNMAKSKIANIYDNVNVVSIYLPTCMKTFKTPEVTSRYLQCLEDSSKNNTILDIPNSVETYCQYYLPRTRCFPDILTSICSQFPKVKKFAEDRLKSTKYPCNQKYE